MHFFSLTAQPVHERVAQLHCYFEDLQLFQDDQTQYEQLTELATSKLVDILKGPTAGLLTVLDKAANYRRRIAYCLGTLYKKEFGLWRNQIQNGYFDGLQTHLLTERYQVCAEKIKRLFSDAMDQLMADGKGELSLCWEKRCSKYEVEILTPARLAQMVADVENKKFAPPASSAVIKAHNRSIEFLNVLYSMRHFLINATQPSAAANVAFIVGTIYLKTNGEWKASTRHLSWFASAMPDQLTEEAREVLKHHAWVCLAHTPQLDIKECLEDLTPLWQKLWREDSTSPTWHKSMRELEYRLHHLTPFGRDSASIMAMSLKGLAASRSGTYIPCSDLDALAQPDMEKFIDNVT